MRGAIAAGPPPRPRERSGGTSLLGGVQVLRALAALSVAFLHIEQAAGFFVGRPGQSPYPWLRALPWEAGVDVFFVISGFVMVHSSARLFGTARSIRPFLARRVARIVPLYWIATTLTVLVAILRPGMLSDALGSDWRMILASYLFIPWPHSDGAIQPVFRLGWTLNYEMLFYAVFAPFLTLSRRVGTIGVALAVGALIAAGRTTQPSSPQLIFWTDPIMLEFIFGVALGALRTEGVRLPRWTRLVLVAAGLALLVATGPDATAYRAVGYGSAASCLVASVVLTQAGPARAWFGVFWMLLGDASYALYLLHPFPMRGLREVWARLHFGGEVGIASYIFASMVLAALLGILAHLAVERPLLRAARRVLGA